MKIELTRFKVRSEKSTRVDKWMQMLRDNLPAVLVTLEDEKMYVESIFREKSNNEEFLYWYSIQGEGGKIIQESNYEIDKKHLEFFDECIDRGAPDWKKDFVLEVAMIPERFRKLMQ